MKKSNIIKTALCTLLAALIAVGLSVTDAQMALTEENHVSLCIFDYTEVSD